MFPCKETLADMPNKTKFERIRLQGIENLKDLIYFLSLCKQVEVTQDAMTKLIDLTKKIQQIKDELNGKVNGR